MCKAGWKVGREPTKSVSVCLEEECDDQSTVAVLPSKREAEVLWKSARVVHPCVVRFVARHCCMSPRRLARATMKGSALGIVPSALKGGVFPQLVDTRDSAKLHPSILSSRACSGHSMCSVRAVPDRSRSITGEYHSAENDYRRDVVQI